MGNPHSSILIHKKHKDWIKRNAINLSQFIRMKIDEEIEKGT